ncbi:MAG TPA: hypothetical protein VM238_22485 [Phycisphaerae bacterium]|nr:hypothetical protein [Phycisphaerae bacterium]
MPLDRQTVDETAGKHIRMMQDGGHKTAAQKDAIRREHERIARMVEQKARKRR